MSSDRPPVRETEAASSAVDTARARVLVVDDEETQRRILADILRASGHRVATAGGRDDALARIDAEEFDIVLTDLKMPGGTGIELLERVKEEWPEIDVILMTAFSSVETAVEAMRKGAYHYLPKPFDRDDLLRTVEQIAERVCLRRENRELRRLVDERYGYRNMLGGSKGIREVYSIIDKVHSNAATVLVRGESGTGKELVARAIHASGVRQDRPFVAINCAAIPESLIESELFGHEKGAFTGALTAKVGRFEEVEDGTLFLDEIGSMQFDLQAKLLRAIQEREFQRIGGREMIPLRGRIVAATSQDLEERMREGKFREDLYFRLNVVPIDLPPLRERDGDLPLLAAHFLETYSRELGKSARTFDPEVLDAFEAWSWPGNVRELENVVQRMVILADDEMESIRMDLVPRPMLAALRGRASAAGREGDGPVAPPASGIDHPSSGADSGAPDGRPGRRENRHESEPEEVPVSEEGDGVASSTFRLPPSGVDLGELEADLIRQALERSGGKLEPAASLLGITYKTLQYRIKKFSLQEWQRP